MVEEILFPKFDTMQFFLLADMANMNSYCGRDICQVGFDVVCASYILVFCLKTVCITTVEVDYCFVWRQCLH